MTVKIGYITFPEAYDRHYANRFGAAPTADDVAQANVDRHEGLRKEWLLKRDLSLGEDEVAPHRPEELSRWLDFCSRQKLVEDEIVAALKAGEIVAECYPDIRVPPQDWHDLDKEYALTSLVIGSGTIEKAGYVFHGFLSRLNPLLSKVPYVDEQAFEKWSCRMCAAARSNQRRPRQNAERTVWTDEKLLKACCQFRQLLLEAQANAKKPLSHTDAIDIGWRSDIPSWIANAVLQTTDLPSSFYSRRKTTNYIENYELDNMSLIRAYSRSSSSKK